MCECTGGTTIGPPDEAAICGPYLKLSLTNVDVALDCYYDAATSALVVIIGSGFEVTTGEPVVACEGGPTTFTPPSCQSRSPFCG